jgi:uncharacterized protein (TIGR04222 family)
MNTLIPMHGILANIISDMPGPTFLAFYGSVIVIICVAVWLTLRSGVKVEPKTVPQVPVDPNPYEIAYLRGGSNEVLRLMILDLIDRDYIKIEGDKIVASPTRQDPRLLEEPLKACYFEVSSGMKAGDIFRSKLPGLIKAYFGAVESHLVNEEMIASEKALNRRWQWGLPAGLLIASLGAYKLLAAIAKGHWNIQFLILMAIIGLIVLVVICKHSVPRLTQRGRDFLENLQTAFGSLKPTVTARRAGTINPDLLLVASVFGIASLAGTAYGYYPTLFKRAMSSTDSSGCGASSCGSSCGSSGCGSSCGGGCGGGCGGCGGS